MRQVYIDLTTDRPIPGGIFIGYIGEHNATELLITIPQSMINESDYQMLVFQVGPMVFKSKKITDDTNETTYRDGNTIHTVLSKSITASSGISLQVECYKENTDGNATLIGKTQTVPNLILKLSPTGCPAFGFDGSYEEIDAAIREVHRHKNLDVLNKFTDSANGDLLYNGTKIGRGIESYSSFSEFPETAFEGCIATLEKDEEAIPNTTPIESGVFYEKLRIKKDITLSNQASIGSIVNGSYGMYSADYSIIDKENSIQGSLAFLYVPGVADMAAFILQDIITHASYKPPEAAGSEVDGYYMFNFISDWDASTITEDQSLCIPRGWNTLLFSEINYTIDSNCNINSDKYYESRPIDFDGEGYGVILENVKLVAGYETKNKTAETKYLSNFFEIPPEATHKKGMYIFRNGKWTYLHDKLEEIQIVESYQDLPIDAPVGAMAIVVCDKAQLNYDDSYIYVSTSNNVDKIYLNPIPDARCILYDYEMTAKLATSSSGQLTPQGAELSIVTNVESEYILVTITDYDGTTETPYIYSWKDQSVTVDDFTIDIYTGWNMLIDSGEELIAKKLDYAETPYLLKRDTDPDNMHFYFPYMSAPNYPKRNYFNNYLISTTPYFEMDNAKGVWIKTVGRWLKLGSDKQFTRKELDS